EIDVDEYEASELDSDFNDDETRPVLPTHEDNADPIVDPKLVSTKPGAIKTQGQFIVHTKLAHRLFYGRKKGIQIIKENGKDVKKQIKPIIGVTRFGTNINDIYRLASFDEPYADAKLIQIEEGLRQAKELLLENIEALRQLLGEMTEMQINPAFSIKPITLPLEFSTPFFGYEATRIVKNYDRLVLLALTTKQTGDILDSDWNRIVNKTGSKIRSVFLISTQYRFTGVTRDDMAANNEKARTAIEKYGELPQDILEGRKRAKHAPKIRSIKH
ncbi:MAG: TIGR03761 family integrating conjugative element protein, partial [Gammaproteobacteria bacterium]|nr:TIGR03761 family integrating conjugative element protein [Gammaproteobacteria bacterium]